MNGSEPDKPALSPEEKAQNKLFKKGRKELGLERVRLALERLQLAWLRTAITFIALGFTAYRFYYDRVSHGSAPMSDFFNGRVIGPFLIFVGLLGLSQATLQHRTNWKRLGKYYPNLSYSVSLVQSYLIIVFTTILLFFSIFEF